MNLLLVSLGVVCGWLVREVAVRLVRLALHVGGASQTYNA